MLLTNRGSETMDRSLEEATMRKVAFRLIPFLWVLYIIAFIDRINLGFASLTMSEDLGLSPTMFGLGPGIFFISYFLCAAPTPRPGPRGGPRRWIARVMISWGVVSAAFALIDRPWQFYS